MWPVSCLPRACPPSVSVLLGVNVILFVLCFNKTPQNFSSGEGAHAKGTTVVPICPLSAPADLEIANSSTVSRGLFGSAGERHRATETAGQRTARVAITSASLATTRFSVCFDTEPFWAVQNGIKKECPLATKPQLALARIADTFISSGLETLLWRAPLGEGKLA